VFETGQTLPAFYFAYETAEHALTRLNACADTKVAEIGAHRDRLVIEGDAWANATFGELGSGATEFYVTYAKLTGTFWAAIDHARRTSSTWPPIAFVASFDDTGGDLPQAIITRHARPN
jgi:hypothetical protein